MESQEIRQIIRETDNGTIRYECGHGAENTPESERKHSTRFCDLCLPDLPPMARRDMLRKEKITESANVTKLREMKQDGRKYQSFLEFLKSSTSGYDVEWSKLSEEEQANLYVNEIEEGKKAQYEALHNL